MPTIKDIADKAGVSQGAVSRILNEDHSLSVSEQTRQRVLAYAKELGYQKKKAVSKAKFTLGVVQWFSKEEELQDSYYLSVRSGIEDFCGAHGIAIVRVFKQDEHYLDALQSVNGLICIGKFSKKEIVSLIATCDNIVFLDMPVDEYKITTLTMDFHGAVNDAMDYLCGLGHKKIGYLGGVEYVGNHEAIKDERRVAYGNYMASHGLDGMTYVKEGNFQTISGYEMMKEMLEEFSNPSDRPTAIFAASDSLAVGAMKAIHEAGLSIPEDISILGFNDTQMSAFLTPALTTVHAPAYDMGQHGANLIFAASNLSIQTPLKAKIPCHLVERDSCGEPRVIEK